MSAHQIPKITVGGFIVNRETGEFEMVLLEFPADVVLPVLREATPKQTVLSLPTNGPVGAEFRTLIALVGEQAGLTPREVSNMRGMAWRKQHKGGK